MHIQRFSKNNLVICQKSDLQNCTKVVIVDAFESAEETTTI